MTDILVDASSSMNEAYVGQESKHAAAIRILREVIIPQLALHHQSKIGVRWFGDKCAVRSIAEPTTMDREQLLKISRAIPLPNGNTPLAEAIDQSIATLSTFDASARIIIVLTDGRSNCELELSDALTKAEQHNILFKNALAIYPIGIGKLDTVAQTEIATIARRTNGQHLVIDGDSGAKAELDVIQLIRSIKTEQAGSTEDPRPLGMEALAGEVKYQVLAEVHSAIADQVNRTLGDRLSTVEDSLRAQANAEIGILKESVASRLDEGKQSIHSTSREINTRVGQLDADVRDLRSSLESLIEDSSIGRSRDGSHLDSRIEVLEGEISVLRDRQASAAAVPEPIVDSVSPATQAALEKTIEESLSVKIENHLSIRIADEVQRESRRFARQFSLVGSLLLGALASGIFFLFQYYFEGQVDSAVAERVAPLVAAVEDLTERSKSDIESLRAKHESDAAITTNRLGELMRQVEKELDEVKEVLEREE